MTLTRTRTSWTVVIVAATLLTCALPAQARIDGLTGTSFSFTVKQDYVSTADGGAHLIWGYANGTGRAQYPGPTLIVNQGDTVTITLANALPAAHATNASIVFPGQDDVTASGGVTGLLTQEAPPDGATTVTYTFTAKHAGTFMYHSGTRPDLEIEMGLVGAIIVRPYGFNPAAPRAYYHDDSRYDREFLFLNTEMDPAIHAEVEAGHTATVDTSHFFPTLWFFNGRNAPDTMLDPFVPWLPTQPYNCFPRIHPGERLLIRSIGAGRDLHPFHHHGNHARIIARDGHLLESVANSSGPDLGYSVFTIQTVPGETVDAIFQWTGEQLGWDVYGTTPHTCTPDVNGFDVATHEYCADHGKPVPVILPDNLSLTFGPNWSGSPFLGQAGSLPPGAGGENPTNGYYFMWHSHTEKEITNDDIFPGGMMTMLVVEAPWVPIVE